tara:strand:- start:449 stop:592 length:144 start_codon:yes stop_codon:yes gene_type:complete
MLERSPQTRIATLIFTISIDVIDRFTSYLGLLIRIRFIFGVPDFYLC